MKTSTTLALLAAVTAAQAQTNSSSTSVSTEIKGGQGPTTSSNSVVTEIKDGKGTITITVDKDGKKETRTIVIDENTPFQALTDEILKKLGTAGLANPAEAPKKTVTYLGVMLSEPAGFPFGAAPGSGGGLPGGYGFGGGGAEGGADGGLGAAAPATTGLPAGTGLAVTGVTPDSPAQKAGLQGGDVLAKLNDQILVNPAQFTTLVRNMKDGEIVKITFVRNGVQSVVDATLASRIEEPVATEQLFGGSGLGGGGGAFSGRVLTVDPTGNVIEATAESLALPPTPPLPPGAPTPPPADDLRPTWEKALREAAMAKDKAASQWQEQLSKWRAEWSDNQKKATEEYRKAIEKMGEELAKARETAEKAREDARRAIDEAMRKMEQDKTKPAPGAEPKPEHAEQDQPKHT